MRAWFGAHYYANGAATLEKNNANGHVPANTISTSKSIQNSDGFVFDASRSSSIYGSSKTVQPPAAAIQYLIKY